MLVLSFSRTVHARIQRQTELSEQRLPQDNHVVRVGVGITWSLTPYPTQQNLLEADFAANHLTDRIQVTQNSTQTK